MKKMTEKLIQYISDENAMCDFGKKLIDAICQVPNHKGITLYLNGELGAGKTTLSRGMIQALGYQGNVKSPTYTLVEEYKLEFMGIRDYFAENTICLIEWAEKGAGLLSAPDLLVNIHYTEHARNIELIAKSETGQHIIEKLN